MPAYSPRNGKRAKGPSAQRKNRSWPLRSSMRIPLQPTRWGRSTPDYITTLWHRSLNPVLRCTWLAPADVRQSRHHNTSSVSSPLLHHRLHKLSLYQGSPIRRSKQPGRSDRHAKPYDGMDEGARIPGFCIPTCRSRGNASPRGLGRAIY